MESNDDFERFRRIAQRSPRESLSPYDQIQDNNHGRRATYGEYLVSPSESNVKRASSFREQRESTSSRPGRLAGSMGGTRSPASPSPIRLESIPQYRHSIYEFARDLGSSQSRDEYEEPSVNLHASPTINRPNRNRGGSMKEIKKYERSKAGYRPSAPAAFPASLSPGNIARNSHSPSRYSNISSEGSVIKVRRFQRKKDGQVVSKGDDELPEVQLRPASSSPYATRQSLNYLQSVVDTNPTIYTDEFSDNSDDESVNGDNEVVEIPAITTTLVHSPTQDDYSDPVEAVRPRTGSPNTLLPEFRNRSRSWAFVAQPNIESPRSCPSPQTSDNGPINDLWTVQVLGMGRVGKTSLCLQFQTSESLDVTLDNRMEDQETSAVVVVVEVNGEQFTLQFIDTNLIQDDFQTNVDSTIIQTADAYLVVYAIDDRTSFIAARSIVGSILGNCKRSSAIVIAANKSDLVRTRAVSTEEGKNLAVVYSCPYFETSTSLNHRVDDLLVGIVVAIQDQRREIEKERARLERISVTSKHGSFTTQTRRRSSLSGIKPPANSLTKFFQKHFSKKDKQSHGLI